MLLSKDNTTELIIRIYLITAFILVVTIQKVWILIALLVPVLVFLMYALLKKRNDIET